jgi:hypothetical protein
MSSESSPPVLESPPLETVLVDRVRAEYLDAPGLSLTGSQMRRLFGLDPHVTAAVLAMLCETGFLVEDAFGRFRQRQA